MLKHEKPNPVTFRRASFPDKKSAVAIKTDNQHKNLKELENANVSLLQPQFFDIVRTFIALINNVAVSESGNAKHSINNRCCCPFTVTLLYTFTDIKEKFSSATSSAVNYR